MVGEQQPEFAEYLRLRRRRQPVNPVPEYEEFLARIDGFFRLRAAAEGRWKERPHSAYGRNGALPLHWDEIAAVLRDGDGPPERLITRIAGNRFVDVSAVGGNLRKTLLRLRERTPLGRVQQVDTACLRWLTQQPGRTAEEKAGASQRILGVVRRENYDTLENRVFKDFLLRAAGQCRAYLDEFGKHHAEHPTVAKTKRFRNLCLGLLENPVFSEIRGLDRLPTPKYVLQQDLHYSKIWHDYQQLVRQEHTAERLWTRKPEVDESWLKLLGKWPGWKKAPCSEGGLDFHTDPRAECDTPLWFNVLDGRTGPLERPFWGNRLGSANARKEETLPRADDLTVVDLTGNKIWRELLVYGVRQNEKPHLQNYGHPNIEPAQKWVTLGEILDRVRKQPHNGESIQQLRDYFEQLASEVEAKRWVVLVPDDWPATVLERILAAIPLGRSRVFLLWRSIASCLDAAKRLGQTVRAGEKVAVLDGQHDGSLLISKIEWAEWKGRLVPRRRAFRRVERQAYRRFPTSICTFPNKSWTRPNPFPPTIANWSISAATDFAMDCPTWVTAGTLPDSQVVDKAPSSTIVIRADTDVGGCLFDKRRRRGEVAYYDELEGLYLIVTRREGYDEKPVPVALVAPNERFPGGEEYKGEEIRDFTLKQGEKSLKLYLAEGDVGDSTPLKLSTTTLEKPTQEMERLLITTRMTPGQGLAQCTFRFESGRLPRPVRIDLSEMQDPSPGEPRTLLEIAENMPRSYPPDLPLVEASDKMFLKIRFTLGTYLAGRGNLVGNEFAKAKRKPLPANPTPIDRLKRINVFGNAEGAKLPYGGRGFDFESLFKKLARDYAATTTNDARMLYQRLIAWTYQGDCTAFAPIWRSLLSDYVAGWTIGNSGYTLLANLCSSPANSKRLLLAVRQKFMTGLMRRENVKAGHSRLCYNLLQFHPEALADITTADCESMMKALEFQYCLKPRHGVLRAMLFMLNRRRYDAGFYREWSEKNLPVWIARPLHKPSLDALREALIAYVCGRGTMQGLPIEDSDGDDD